MSYGPGQNNLQLLNSFASPFEAEHLKMVLEAEGIAVTLDGLHASSTFGFNTTIGGVKLRVPADQLARARQIMYELDSADQTQWTCAQCREVNEPSFDFCWSCGGERSNWEPEPSNEPKPTFAPEDFVSDQPAVTSDHQNPYSPPQTPLTPVARPAASSDSDDVDDVEDRIRRGFRASIFGLMFFPPLLHTYSLLVLLGTADQMQGVSSRAKIQWRIGMTISALAILFGGLIWLRISRMYFFL